MNRLSCSFIFGLLITSGVASATPSKQQIENYNRLALQAQQAHARVVGLHGQFATIRTTHTKILCSEVYAKWSFDSGKMQDCSAQVGRLTAQINQASAAYAVAHGRAEELRKRLGLQKSVDILIPRKDGFVDVYGRSLRDIKNIDEIVGDRMLALNKVLDFKTGRLFGNKAILDIQTDKFACRFTLSPVRTNNIKLGVPGTASAWFVTAKDSASDPASVVLTNEFSHPGASLTVEGSSEDVTKCLLDYGLDAPRVPQNTYHQEGSLPQPTTT